MNGKENKGKLLHRKELLEMKKINLAVLISGRGSNLKAIIDSIKRGYLDKVNLAVVVANKNAPGLKYAQEFNVPTHIVPRIVNGKKISLEEHDKKVMEVLEEYNIDLIALAGYDQILQKEFVNRYRWKIMNIHPSLLPAFPGTMHAQRDAWEYGVKISGCTVHFVTEDVDAGPIIIQAAVPVKDEDTPEKLADRILEHEHIIYSKAIKLFSENRLKIVGRRVLVIGEIVVTPIKDNDLEKQMYRIGVCDEGIVNILKKKKRNNLNMFILIENITPREAMILKQEMLSRGGDCAVPKECILNNLVFIDVILIGNTIQIKSLIKCLRKQVFNLPEIGKKLEEFWR